MYLPRLHMRGLARAMKAVVALPVLVVGRIVEPGAAEDLIRSGDADLVGMTRALIADPELPAKARSGRTAEIRHCVGANEGCLGRLFRGLHVSCIQSPESGRERELRPLVNAEQRRFVVVIGGGPAGLEAARLAGLRGHQVVLLERESTLGGQVNIARRAPGREELGGVTDQLAAAVARLGIEVRLGCEVTASSVLELKPDAVIVATGSAPRLPALADEDGRLVSAHAALAGTRLGQKVVVLDAKGDMAGPTTADFLARRRHDVTFVTPLRAPGLRIEAMTWRILYERLLEAGMTFLADTDVVALSETGIVVRHVVSGREQTIADVVNVVAACGGRAETGLYRELRWRAPALELQLIGDAAQPRQIEQAIYEGHMAGRTI
jgi:thioredoxin reductase